MDKAVVIRKYTNPWVKAKIQNQHWREKAQQHSKFVIEIGAGVGYHAINYSCANENNFLIALERTKNKYMKFYNRFNNHCIDNLMIINGDATEWISKNIYPGEVSKYFILYPNPYPKESQANKRFSRAPFLHHLIESLSTGGTITIATNEQFYYLECKKILPYNFKLKLVTDSILSDTFIPRSHFEKKYLLRGDKCYNMVFKKIPWK